MRGHTSLVLLPASAALALLMLLSIASAQDGIDVDKYAQVKAGMTLNFLRYTTWPDASFASDESPIIVIIVGRDRMESHLRPLLEKGTIGSRRIELQHLEHPETNKRGGGASQAELDIFHERLRAAHLVFVASTEQNRVREILDPLKGEAALTVSDIREFADRGGMLELAVRRGRVAFDANTGEIDEAGLKVSSKVLRLANNIVKTREPER